MIVNNFWGNGIPNSTLPVFTYTGNYTTVNDGSAGWRIKFLTSGTLTLQTNRMIDLFLVGGGASGNYGRYDPDPANVLSHGAGGGGGGYTKTYKNIQVYGGKSYSIVVGAGGVAVGDVTSETRYRGKPGGSSSAFGYTAAGGTAYYHPTGVTMPDWFRYGGNGGSGGGDGGRGARGRTYATINPYDGGSNGGNGGTSKSSSNRIGGYGQGTTTCEFAEANGALYGGGGGGGGCDVQISQDYGITHYHGGAGGSGGGGSGAYYDTNAGSGAANTGGGGGGGFSAWTGISHNRMSGAGGSGIVIIRNHR